MKKRNVFGKIMRISGMVIGGIALAVAFAFVFGYIVMHLWNWLMPDLFGLKVIGYWKAIGIVLLAKILFSSFGHHGHGGHMRHMRFKCGKEMRGFHNRHPEIAENYEEYTEYWEEEGSKAFAEYLKKKNKGQEK